MSGSGKVGERRTSKGFKKAFVTQGRVPTRKSSAIKGIREQRRGGGRGRVSKTPEGGRSQLSTGCCVLSVSRSFEDIFEMT